MHTLIYDAAQHVYILIYETLSYICAVYVYMSLSLCRARYSVYTYICDSLLIYETCEYTHTCRIASDATP